jgi:Asp-tRNA(Asn)/Glu-tRNA(Gln) amidotransferase A subunit family amidase
LHLNDNRTIPSPDVRKRLQRASETIERSHYFEAVRFARRFKHRVQATLDSGATVILTPATPRERYALGGEPSQGAARPNYYTRFLSLLDGPTATVPVWDLPGRFPIGIQAAAATTGALLSFLLHYEREVPFP